MNESIHVTEKDLYALIGEQTMVIRFQEQMIARLQAELDQATPMNGNGVAGPTSASGPLPR